MSNACAAGLLLRQRSELQRLWRGAGPMALILCLGASVCREADAHPVAPMASWPQLETDLNVDREMIDTRWSSVVRPPSSAPDFSLAGDGSSAAWNGLNKLPAFVELSPTRIVGSDPQVNFRPQLVLGGGSSESLRSWLRVAGFNVSTCTAPLMRMHSGFADSNTHANVSVTARCSFH